ncbi:MAG: N-acetylmannosamine-6-phosphate 2-epimerase [Anaerolineaceae bacterium]|jgi:N-acylglucosamine-6-phosphate 2-epimerase|nr:N-acetylmannosamine-6-phosphate 2-epimerase [Anaerolineaceae bacterium]
MHETLEKLKGGLIVSCQSLAPLNEPHVTGLIAQAAVMAGAHGIRACRPENIRAVRALVDVPIVGIFKQNYPGFDVFVTPTIASALAVVDAGAEIVGIEVSQHPRPDGSSFRHLVDAVHARGALVMADSSTREEGLFAAEQGADIVASSLSGYTAHSIKTPGPDLDLVAFLVKETGKPVNAEGRYHSPEDVAAAFARGAFMVSIGAAITEPQFLTKKFLAAVPKK